MHELLILAALGAALAFWFDHRQTQDRVIAQCRRACNDAGVQFLDDTVALARTRLARDGAGRVRLARRFTFEYGTAPGERGRGYIDMLGAVPVALELTVPPPGEG